MTVWFVLKIAILYFVNLLFKINISKLKTYVVNKKRDFALITSQL